MSFEGRFRNKHIAIQQEDIQTRDDLVLFVRDLLADLRSRPDAWENASLDTYLEALAAWVEDMEGYYRNRGEATPEPPSWKTLGEILLAATMYE
jgi:hypothetical protein